MISKSSSAVWIGIAMANFAYTANAQGIPSNEDLMGAHSFTEGGPVSIAANKPLAISHLRISAIPNHGKLISGGSPIPFQQLTTNTQTQWSATSNTDVTIDGIIQLDLEVEAGAFLHGQVFDGERTSAITFNGVGSELFSHTRSETWFAVYPEEGGNLLMIAPDGPIQMRGANLGAEPGILTAVDPAPFTFFIPNDAAPGDVALGILRTSVFIDGVVELGISVAPNTPPGSIVATWGEGAGPTAVPVLMMPSLERFIAEGTCTIPPDELVGDLDDNGTVEFSDFLMLAGNFGLEVDTYGEGDINCNGTVDFEDFIRLGGNFGMSRPAASASIPEPATVNLFLVGLFVAMQFRRRWA